MRNYPRNWTHALSNFIFLPSALHFLTMSFGLSFHRFQCGSSSWRGRLSAFLIPPISANLRRINRPVALSNSLSCRFRGGAHGTTPVRMNKSMGLVRRFLFLGGPLRALTVGLGFKAPKHQRTSLFLSQKRTSVALLVSRFPSAIPICTSALICTPTLASSLMQKSV